TPTRTRRRDRRPRRTSRRTVRSNRPGADRRVGSLPTPALSATPQPRHPLLRLLLLDFASPYRLHLRFRLLRRRQVFWTHLADPQPGSQTVVAHHLISHVVPLEPRTVRVDGC